MPTYTTKGFTIVELLVVIVAISILAAVSVTAYNGIRKTSEDSAVAASVKAMVQLVEAYAAVNGGKVPQADWACVGEISDFPAENGYSAGWCHQPVTPEPIPNGSDHPVNTITNGKFKTIVSKMPNGRLPEVDLGYGMKYRGMLYDSAASQNGSKPVIQYYVKGQRTACPIGTLEYTTDTYARCNYMFTSVSSETGT